MRRRSRHARLPPRQEPPTPPHGTSGRGALLDARDDPRVRTRAADESGGSVAPTPPRRAHARDRTSAHLSEEDDEPFHLSVVLAERDDVRAALDWAAEPTPSWGSSSRARSSPSGAHMRRQRACAGSTYSSRETSRFRRCCERARSASAVERRTPERNWAVSDPAYEESLALYDARRRRGMSSIRTRLAYRASGAAISSAPSALEAVSSSSPRTDSS